MQMEQETTLGAAADLGVEGSTLAQERRALAAAEQQREAILGSTSWRVTAPLRWLQRLARPDLAQTGAEPAGRQAPVGRAEDALGRARRARRAAEGAVDALLASASWRLSAPLRWRQLVRLEQRLARVHRREQRLEAERARLRQQAAQARAAAAATAPLPLRLAGLEAGQARAAAALQAQAAQAAAAGDQAESIRCWQDLVALLGEQTPAAVYARLSEAYARRKGPFGGSEAENRCWGDRPKHALLGALQAALEPPLYLEIGVDTGRSLACAHGDAIGVDPRPELALRVRLGARQCLITQSSDAFFRAQAQRVLRPAPALVFIDGMHLFEFALRDFINSERSASPAALVVVDDIYPCHPTQALRRRRSTAWTGDIWKLHQALARLRPDLTLLALNAEPTGLLLIAGIDPANSVLSAQYEALVTEYAREQPPPAGVLARHGAIASAHPVVMRLAQTLRQARLEGWDVAQVRAALSALQPAIEQARQPAIEQAAQPGHEASAVVSG